MLVYTKDIKTIAVYTYTGIPFLSNMLFKSVPYLDCLLRLKNWLG